MRHAHLRTQLNRFLVLLDHRSRAVEQVIAWDERAITAIAGVDRGTP